MVEPNHCDIQRARLSDTFDVYFRSCVFLRSRMQSQFDNQFWVFLFLVFIVGVPAFLIYRIYRIFRRNRQLIISEQGLKTLKELAGQSSKHIVDAIMDAPTNLHDAAYQGHKDVAEQLIAWGADVNAKGPYDDIPLHDASARGHKNVAELLIAKGADVNAKNKADVTPLHGAAYQGNKDIAELLITKGADVNAKDKDGHTPLNNAIRRGHDNVAKVLRQHGGK